MSCNCAPVAKSQLWTPIPEFRQPTEIQPGENIDCYMKRSGSQSGLMNDVGPKTPDRIDNNSVTADLDLKVDTTFQLTPNSTKTATSWSISVNGTSGLGPLTELTFDTSSGKLTGTVSDSHANTNYKLMIVASDGSDIDSREFNFFPKKASKDDVVKFGIPLDGNVHVTCGFGPRHPPAPGASSDHKGMDFARVDHSKGNILAAADGTVVRCGPGAGWGNVIFIEHYDGQNKLVATTVYGHWSEAYVTVGQKVGQGQKIALEGNVGIGSGAHLHFELHKGKFGNPTDPAPYLNGAVQVAANNTDSVGPDGTTTPTGFTSQNNSNTGMTSAESSAGNDCPAAVPLPASGAKFTDPDTSSPPPAGSVTDAITQACTEAGLSTDDIHFIMTIAKIESSFNPTAKNPTSSALGLYQMLDGIATKYYGLIGQTPSYKYRTDPYLATKAMIKFYQNEFLPYWNGFQSSGNSTIAGKKINPTAWSGSSAPHYSGLSKYEFMYGLIHHDGVGTAVSGIDKGGVAYWKSKNA